MRISLLLFLLTISERLSWNSCQKDCPDLCPGDDGGDLVVTAKVHTNLWLSFCVPITPIRKEIVLNGTRVIPGHQRGRWSWDFQFHNVNQTYNVTVTLADVTLEDTGQFNITAFEAEGNCSVTRTVAVSVRDDDFPKVISDNDGDQRSNSETHEAQTQTMDSGMLGLAILSSSFFLLIVVMLLVGCCIFLRHLLRIHVAMVRQMETSYRPYNLDVDLGADPQEYRQDPPLETSNLQSGRYLSREGLVYISLDHLQATDTPRPHSRGSTDSVVYAVLDKRYL